MLLQDLIAHFSLDEQLHEKLETVIQKRLNSENYVQIITLMDKYQTHCLPSRSPFYLDINIQNCGKIFEDALHYNQSKFIGRIFHILYDFININYRYLEEKIDPNLCEYYKQELLDDNDELYNLAIRYDTGKQDCINL
ncbi:hypothetical protein BLA29_006907 [Euroglyphus maynei]|uniref:Uncharacterized protein n=1 Tax=Euroglyphus maynei TaxID=6958 RepID=A0A1Y3B9N5_EURMA|nr:hypothetical protein BLA29_006907 [Euroglyphus maynei]